MLHFQYAVLSLLIQSVSGQYTVEDEVPKSLPEEFILDLYEKYKEAVEEGDEEGVVTRRQLQRLNRNFDVHVQRLKVVNGFKTHNLIVRENTETGPLIYINNPLESRVPHAYLSLDEFRNQLEKRASQKRDRKSKGRQTEVYFQASKVDFTFRFGSNKGLRSRGDLRRKKVLGGGNAKIFEAKSTKSRYFQHTYMANPKHNKHHNKDTYYHENRVLNKTMSKVTHSTNQRTTSKKQSTTLVTNVPDLTNEPAYLAIQVTEFNALELSYTPESSAIQVTEFKELHEEASESDTDLGGTVATAVDPKRNGYLETTVNPKTTAYLEPSMAQDNVDSETSLRTIQPAVDMEHVDSQTSPKSIQPAVSMESQITDVWKGHHHVLKPERMVGLRDGTENTVMIKLNVTKQDYENSTIQFRASMDYETLNTKRDLTPSDNNVTEAATISGVIATTTDDVVIETVTTSGATDATTDDKVTEPVTTSKVTDKTTDYNETETVMTPGVADRTTDEDVTESETTTRVTDTTTDDNVTETETTTEDDETRTDDDVTETSTVVTVKREQPLKPIWMRSRYTRIRTTRTTTTRRTLGRPLVFMDG